MNKTVILSPYNNEVSGTMERVFERDGLHLKCILNHPLYKEGQMFRLYVMSTSFAARKPYLAGYYESVGKNTKINATVSARDLKNENLNSADSFLITLCDGQKEEPLAAAFYSLEWNVARFLTNPLPEKEHEQTQSECEKDLTISNAIKTLDGLKRGKKVDKTTLEKYIFSLQDSIKEYEICSDIKDENFEWRKISEKTSVTDLSSIRHILSSRAAASAIKKAGYYILGINKSDPCHVAVGIPGCRHICPMPSLTDCCGYSDGYHITGVYFDEDGQYFEKYLQNL